MPPPSLESRPGTSIVNTDSDTKMMHVIDTFDMLPPRRNSSPELVMASEVNVMLQGARTLFGFMRSEEPRQEPGTGIPLFEWKSAFSPLPEEEEGSSPATPVAPVAAPKFTEKLPASSGDLHITQTIKKHKLSARKLEKKLMEMKSSESSVGARTENDDLALLYNNTSHQIHRRHSSYSDLSVLLAEAEQRERQEEDDVFPSGRRPSSLPNTPRVSPKLLRKMSVDTVPASIETPSEGQLFMASLANLLHSVKKPLQKQNVLSVQLPPSQPAPVKRAMSAPPAPPTTSQIQIRPQSAPAENTRPMLQPEPIPDIDKPKPEKKSVVTSIINWSTTSKAKPSNKEMNFFSPTSF